MISSVIAKFQFGVSPVPQTLQQITDHPDLEIGEMIGGFRLPITIESVSNQSMEETTRWLQSLEGVEFVDVVYVHFEPEDETHLIPPKRKTERS